MKGRAKQEKQGAQEAQVATLGSVSRWLNKLPQADDNPMLQIHFERGYSVPRLVCAICGDPLHNAAVAAAVYDASARDGVSVPPLYVHKGSIDHRTCHLEVDRLIEANGGIPAWQELRDHLIYLVANCGITAEQLVRERRKRARE